MMELLTTSLAMGYKAAVYYIPRLITAAIVVIIGWFIGKLIGRISHNIIERFKFEAYLMEKSNISVAFIFSVIFKWAIYLVFLEQAAEIIGVSAITNMFRGLVRIIPNIIGAAAVLLGGYAIALYVKDEMLLSKEFYADLLGKLIFFFILYITVATALDVLHIPTTLINDIFLLFIGALALGAGIAIGLGLKDVVRDLAAQYVSKYKGEEKAGSKRARAKKKE